MSIIQNDLQYSILLVKAQRVFVIIVTLFDQFGFEFPFEAAQKLTNFDFPNFRFLHVKVDRSTDSEKLL